MQASRTKYEQNILPFQSAYSSNTTNTNGSNFNLNLNFNNNNNNGHDDFKNQYSTFIQQLEQTTQKLMNQVFNTEYKPEVDDLWEEEIQVSGDKNNKTNNIKNKNKNKNNTKNVGVSGIRTANFGNSKQQYYVQGNQSFHNFMVRNSKWCKRKENNLQNQSRKRDLQIQKQLRDVPKILRGSIEKLQPIYERAYQIHASKQKKRAFKKIEQKKKQDEQIKSYSFHPQINPKNKTRTLEQYLRDKNQWEKKKIQGREQRKLKQEAGKYVDCTFTPTLVSKQIQQKVLKTKRGQRVQDRLLRSLEKAIAQV